MQSAPADPELFCRLSAVAATFIQSSHDQPDLIVVDINADPGFQLRGERGLRMLHALSGADPGR